MKKIFDDTMKPYFIRAIYDWCVDKRLSPRLLARADEKTGAPQKLAQEGKIVFNLSPEAVRKLLIDNDGVSFTARFAGGETREIVLAMDDVLAIFDNEEGRGVFFAPPQAEVQDKKEESATPKQESTNLQVPKWELTFAKPHSSSPEFASSLEYYCRNNHYAISWIPALRASDGVGKLFLAGNDGGKWELTFAAPIVKSC